MQQCFWYCFKSELKVDKGHTFDMLRWTKIWWYAFHYSLRCMWCIFYIHQTTEGNFTDFTEVNLFRDQIFSYDCSLWCVLNKNANIQHIILCKQFRCLRSLTWLTCILVHFVPKYVLLNLRVQHVIRPNIPALSIQRNAQKDVPKALLALMQHCLWCWYNISVTFWYNTAHSGNMFRGTLIYSHRCLYVKVTLTADLTQSYVNIENHYRSLEIWTEVRSLHWRKVDLLELVAHRQPINNVGETLVG